MAIISIDSLAEISTAGDEDVLLISTSSGAKKIKASAVGGGGGGAGSSDFQSIALTMEGVSLSTVLTAAEIAALYTAGKCLGGTLAMGTSHMRVWFGMLIQDGDSYTLNAVLSGMNGSQDVAFEASSGDSVMTYNPTP